MRFNYYSPEAQFRPMTYGEYMAPLYDYAKAYKETEAAYGTLAEQAEAFRDVVNQQNSKEAYDMYNNYMSKLDAVIGDFSNGMTAANRNALMDMKRGYARSIAPIARASEAMKEANAFRDKAGPDAIFEKERYTSLDDFLHGQVANNSYQSAKAITARTATMAKAIGQKLMSDPELKPILDGQSYMMTMNGGGSYEDLMAAVLNSPKAQGAIADLKKQMLEESGANRYDSSGKMAIEGAINEGLFAGLGEPVVKFIDNKDYLTQYQKASLALTRDKINGGKTVGDTGLTKRELLSAATHGLHWDEQQKKWVYDENEDPQAKLLNLRHELRIDEYNQKDSKGGGSYRASIPESSFAFKWEDDVRFDRIGDDDPYSPSNSPIEITGIENSPDSKVSKAYSDLLKTPGLRWYSLIQLEKMSDYIQEYDENDEEPVYTKDSDGNTVPKLSETKSNPYAGIVKYLKGLGLGSQFSNAAYISVGILPYKSGGWGNDQEAVVVVRVNKPVIGTKVDID